MTLRNTLHHFSTKYRLNLPIDNFHDYIRGSRLRREENTSAALVHEVDRQIKSCHRQGKKWVPKSTGSLRRFFSRIKALYLAGGGGAGRAYPAAFHEASKFGLDLNNVEVVNATSVGAIQGLMITLGYSAIDMKSQLIRLPAEQLQDWDFWSVLTFFKHWGVCRGEVMEDYFKKVIKLKTGLEDPTFKELYDAGYRKEFRVITTNVTKRGITIFSYKKTPNAKVAQIVALTCKIPIVYRPVWLRNEKGEKELFTDGGLIQNYPWGVASAPNMPLEEQLGFMFVHDPMPVLKKNHENHSFLETFWHYLRGLFWVLFFQSPDALSAMIKQQTVQIKTGDYNVLKFTATRKEQKKLDAYGRVAVTDYVAEVCGKKYASLTPGYHSVRKENQEEKGRSVRSKRRVVCR